MLKRIAVCIVKSTEHKVDVKGKRFPGRDAAAMTDAFRDRGPGHSGRCLRVSNDGVPKMVGDGGLAIAAPDNVLHDHSHSISSTIRLSCCAVSVPYPQVLPERRFGIQH